MSKILTFITLLFVTVLVTSCSSPTEDEALTKVKNNVKKNLESDKPNSNIETEQYSYFQPFGMNVVEEVDNNIVLKKSNRTVAIFFDKELQTTNRLYEGEKKEDLEPLLLQKTSNNTTGFVKVVTINDDLYELTIGLGGVKASTTSNLNELPNYADILSKIVNSFKFK